MPVTKISLKPAEKALAKIRKELVKRKIGAPPARVAALNKEITDLDKAIKSIIIACHNKYNVA